LDSKHEKEAIMRKQQQMLKEQKAFLDNQLLEQEESDHNKYLITNINYNQIIKRGTKISIRAKVNDTLI